MKRTFVFIRRNPALCASGLIIALLAAAALLAPLVAPFDPLAIDLGSVKQSPGSTHLFGTDTLGRDVFSRVVYGARTSLAIGLSATALSLVIGLVAGMLGGYAGGRLDACITMITDLFLAFPSLLLAIAISVLLPDRGHHQGGRLYPGRISAELSGAGHSAARADLGRYDQPAPQLSAFCRVDGIFPGLRHSADRVRLQYIRRLPARQA